MARCHSKRGRQDWFPQGGIRSAPNRAWGYGAAGVASVRRASEQTNRGRQLPAYAFECAGARRRLHGDYQITRINKPDRENRHERITHIGNGQWRLTLDTAIAMIGSGQHSFYTLDPVSIFSSSSLLGGAMTSSSSLLGMDSIRRANIRVIRHGPAGYFSPYLRTEKDGVPTDNLLSLPPCSFLTPVVTSLWKV